MALAHAPHPAESVLATPDTDVTRHGLSTQHPPHIPPVPGLPRTVPQFVQVADRRRPCKSTPMTPEVLTDEEQCLLAMVSGDRARHIRIPEQGRDNRVVIVDERWVLRTPKTHEARTYLLNEQAVLEKLSERFPVPRPLARHGDGIVYEYIPGRALDKQMWAQLSPADKRSVGLAARSILLGLHSLRTSVLPAPEDILDSAWVRSSIDACAEMEPRRPLAFEPGDLLQRFESAWGLGEAPMSVVHVDLKPPHLLVDGNAISVIDFGGVSLGDPALDYGVLTHHVGDDFISTMGITDRGLLARARCYADLYMLRMCTRGWTRTAPHWK